MWIVKKKILCLTLCTILLISLTGCGSKSEEEKDSSNNTNTAEKSKPTIEINEIMSKYDSGIAAVKSTDDEIYIIDEEGNPRFKIEEKLTSGYSREVEVKNGYVTLTDCNGTSCNSIIYDASGKELKSETGARYGKVSKSGYFVVKRWEDSLANGTTDVTTIENLDGKVIKKVKSASGNYNILIGGNIFYIVERTSDGEDSTTKLYNPENGKSIECNLNADLERHSYKYDLVINQDKKEVYYEDLSQKYSIADNGILNANYYSSEDGIYDIKTGKLVKDLSEGNVKNIYSYDNVYYVTSETGYYYTLDKNFNYIKNPEKNDKYELLGVSDEGVVVNNYSTKKIQIIDQNYEVVKELNIDTNNEFDFIYPESNIDGNIIYLKDNGIFNIKLNKKI